jgi:hypothetical protein
MGDLVPYMAADSRSSSWDLAMKAPIAMAAGLHLAMRNNKTPGSSSGWLMENAQLMHICARQRLKRFCQAQGLHAAIAAYQTILFCSDKQTQIVPSKKLAAAFIVIAQCFA